MFPFRNSLVLILALAATPAAAAESLGCGHFKWPLDHEKALLAKPTAVASGGPATVGAGENLTLAPQGTAKLPQKSLAAAQVPE